MSATVYSPVICGAVEKNAAIHRIAENVLRLGANIPPTRNPKASSCDQKSTGSRPHRRVRMTAAKPPQPSRNMAQLVWRYNIGDTLSARTHLADRAFTWSAVVSYSLARAKMEATPILPTKSGTTLASVIMSSCRDFRPSDH